MAIDNGYCIFKEEVLSKRLFESDSNNLFINDFSQLRRRSLRNKKPPAMRVRAKS